MQKNLFFVLIAFMAICSSCQNELNKMTTRNIPCPTYSAIECNFPAEIWFTSKNEQICLTTHESIIDDLKCDVDKNGVMHITMNDLHSKNWTRNPHIVLPLPEKLDSVVLYSMISLNSDAKVKTEDIRFRLSGGACNIKLEMEAHACSITSYSYGTNIELYGTANHLNIHANSLNLQTENLEVDTCSCDVYSSNLNLWVEKALDVKAHDSQITYKGDCEVTKELWNSTLEKK